ncbi:MAG: SDR family oxidoreductase, partial [Methylocystis sp.]
CEAAIHCAALVGPALGRAEPARAVDVNVMGTSRLLELARERRFRIVNVSTATLYGHRPDLKPLDESEKPDPVSIYDATKLMAETLCDAYRKTFGIVAASIRTGFVYGFGSRIGQYFVPSALAGESVREQVGGDHPCDFTYVVDLARALVDAAEKPFLPEPVYNVSGGVLKLRRDFAAAVRQAIPGADIDAGAGVDPARHLRGPSILDRAGRDFGFAPRFSLAQGVADWVGRVSAFSSAGAA